MSWHELGRKAWIEEAFVRFEPSLHPRDAQGKFSKLLSGLKGGQSAVVPWGVRVRRSESKFSPGYLVGRTHGILAGPSLRHGIALHDSPESAARAVFDSQAQYERITGDPAPQRFTEPNTMGPEGMRRWINGQTGLHPANPGGASPRAKHAGLTAAQEREALNRAAMDADMAEPGVYPVRRVSGPRRKGA